MRYIEFVKHFQGKIVFYIFLNLKMVISDQRYAMK